MAAILNAKEIETAKAWLHDIFVWGGIVKAPIRSIDISRYRYMYGQHPDNTKKDYRDQAVIICDAIIKRKVGVKEFQSYDKALERLSYCAFTPNLKTLNRFDFKKCSKEELANFIAWFCKENKYWWLNKNMTTYEMTEIREHSTLGKALWDNYLFYYNNNAPQNADASSQSAADDAADNAAAQPAEADDAQQASQAPQQSAQPQAAGKKQPINPFKSRGPLSNVAVDLIGKPNEKIKLTGTVFAINGFDASRGTPVEDCAYVRPVEEKNQQKYMSGNTNKLLFGKAKGYGYCQIFFDNKNDADVFLHKVD